MNDFDWGEVSIEQLRGARSDLEKLEANQERHQRCAELYEKMVSSGLFSDDELSLAKFEFGL